MNNTSQRRILMARHGNVAEQYRALCYGRSDVELAGDAGAQTRALAEKLSALPITHLFHSGLSRTRALADEIANLTGLTPIADVGLQELDFGDWELRTWDQIHAAAPEALGRLLAEPADFSPPGGETIAALARRVLAWYRKLPSQGVIVAIAHGGSIAALRGTLAGFATWRWPDLIPPPAGLIELNDPTEYVHFQFDPSRKGQVSRGEHSASGSSLSTWPPAPSVSVRSAPRAL